MNVQQREYWCRAFFENGFLDDINYRPKYLTSYAVLFRRSENFGRQVEDYERNAALLTARSLLNGFTPGELSVIADLLQTAQRSLTKNV